MNQLSDCFYDQPNDAWREVREGGRFETPAEDSRPTSSFSRAVALLLIGCFATPIVLPLFPTPQLSPSATAEVVSSTEINLPHICSTIAEQVLALRQLQQESKSGVVRPERFLERCDEITTALDRSMDLISQCQFSSDQQRQARELMLVVSLAGEAKGQLMQAIDADNAEDRNSKNGYADRWLRSACEQLEQTRASFP